MAVAPVQPNAGVSNIYKDKNDPRWAYSFGEDGSVTIVSAPPGHEKAMNLTLSTGGPFAAIRQMFPEAPGGDMVEIPEGVSTAAAPTPPPDGGDVPGDPGTWMRGRMDTANARISGERYGQAAGSIADQLALTRKKALDKNFPEG